ncbi:hypothetical protein ACFXOS_19885 [Streptomyces sp. NPDC059175]|uniref:hypothetical protein n=1 Tax=Streptomyces sp. NPDC059175 TaxID=3346757 RepID=UPI0036CD82C0
MTRPTSAATPGADNPGRPARPERPAGYWARIDAAVAKAPPLSPEQQLIIRAAFARPTQNREAA